MAVVAGGIYPSFIQRFQVEPAESSREAPYIERNIEATRAAMGLADGRAPGPSTTTRTSPAQQLLDNEETVRNIRLLDPGVVTDTYQQLQAERPFYRLNDLDVDRYEIDGETTQVVISARELSTSGIPQQSWEGQHLAFTHGYGAAVAPANAVTTEGRPDFVVGDIPVASDDDDPRHRPARHLLRRGPRRLLHRRGHPRRDRLPDRRAARPSPAATTARAAWP